MMPAYNAQQTIARALKSLQYQTFSNWECIIVDDGSTDKTVHIVESFIDKDTRFKIIKLSKNMGRGHARKLALSYCMDAQCDFIAMLDADDWYYPTKLQDQINAFLKHSEVDAISCRMAVVDKQSNIIGVRGSISNQVGLFSKPSTVPLPHASTMFKKAIVGENTYDTTLKYGQDMDFLRRILLDKKYLLIENIGYVYEEGYSNKFSKSFTSYFYSAKSYFKFFKEFKLFISIKMLSEYMKAVRLFLYYIIGNYEILIQNRSLKPNQIEVKEFNQYRKLLEEFK